MFNFSDRVRNWLEEFEGDADAVIDKISEASDMDDIDESTLLYYIMLYDMDINTYIEFR